MWALTKPFPYGRRRFYLINDTKILFIKLIFSIVLVTHLYKLYKNYEINEDIYKDDRRYLYNLLLFGALILLVNNRNYILFVLLFIVTGIIYRKISDNKYIYNNVYGSDIIIIIISSLLLIVYPNYKYKYIFMMEIVNHSVILFQSWQKYSQSLPDHLPSR